MILLVCTNVRKEKKGNHVINIILYMLNQWSIKPYTWSLSFSLCLISCVIYSNAVMMGYSLNIFENSDLYVKIKEEEQK
jgi:hypothetical protein